MTNSIVRDILSEPKDTVVRVHDGPTVDVKRVIARYKVCRQTAYTVRILVEEELRNHKDASPVATGAAQS